MQAREIEDRLKSLVENAAKTITTDLVENLTLRNPRLTGFSAGNWIASIGPGGRSPIGTKKTVSEAEDAQQAGLDEVNSQFRFGDPPIHVTNNVDYVQLLNSPATTSKKAAPGWIQRSILAAVGP